MGRVPTARIGSTSGKPRARNPEPSIRGSAPASLRPRLAGRPCFAGTRVAVRTLFDYPAGGDSLDQMLEQFPSVRREHALAVLEMAAERLGAGALSEPVPRPAKIA